MYPITPVRPYKVYFEHRPHSLFARITSDQISYEIARGYWGEILTMLHKRRYARIFVEKEIPTGLEAHDLYRIASELAHTVCGGIRIAIHDRYYDRERCTFEETVASNRGLQLRISDDLVELQEWLLYSTIPMPRERFPLIPHGHAAEHLWRSTPHAQMQR